MSFFFERLQGLLKTFTQFAVLVMQARDFSPVFTFNDAETLFPVVVGVRLGHPSFLHDSLYRLRSLGFSNRINLGVPFDGSRVHQLRLKRLCCV